MTAPQRAKALRAILAALIIGVVSWAALGKADALPAWEFPNGGTLAPSKVVERPDGLYESWPARCEVFEDGSARCGEWGGGNTFEAPVDRGPEVGPSPEAEALREALGAQTAMLRRALSEMRAAAKAAGR